MTSPAADPSFELLTRVPAKSHFRSDRGEEERLILFTIHVSLLGLTPFTSCHDQEGGSNVVNSHFFRAFDVMSQRPFGERGLR